MESGIYDARGRLIETNVERKEESQVPFSSQQTGGESVFNQMAQQSFNTSNYSGNIIIRGANGKSVIELRKDGSIVINDDTHPRALFGKQIGGF